MIDNQCRPAQIIRAMKSTLRIEILATVEEFIDGVTTPQEAADLMKAALQKYADS